MKQRLLKTGIPLPEMFNSSGGGIAKAFLTLLLMFVTMTASASWYVNLQFNNDTYGWSKSKGDREYTSYTTFNMSSRAPSFNGKSSDIKISFAGDFEDGRIEYAKNTTIRITAPDGYRIEQVLLDEPDRVGALSSKNYGNYSYSCTEGTGNNQTMVMSSKDAGLKEITLTTNDNRRRFRSRCIKVWIVKEVESWLNFPASYRVAPGSNISVATLSDYGGGNGNSYTATTSNGNIATYDAASNKLNGVNRGTTSITVNYAGNDIYATGSKTFNVEVGNTNNLSIPNSNRVDVSVTRNGQTIAAGTPVFDLDQLTYRFTAKNGYTLLGPATVTRNAYEGFPMVGALKQENGTFLLSNAEDWTNFCYSGTTGNYRMTADITADRNAANQNTFNGTFDGDRHTLTVNYNTNSIGNLAPFCNISEATIKNLHVAGSQYVRTRKYIGGLVGKVFGNNASNIENCEVSTALSYGDKDNCGAGGFIGEANASVNITNCIFNGSFSSQGTGFSGFVGAARKTNNKIQGCFMIATSIKEANGNNSLFVSGNAQYSSTNYYVNPGNWSEQGYGTKVSQWQVASGELAYKCNLKQDLVGNNKDNVPHLFLDDSKRVVKGMFTLNGKEIFTSYTNPGNTFPMPDNFAKSYASKLAYNTDVTVEVLQKADDGYYLINNKDDWDILSTCFGRDDFNALATNVRLNADIDVTTMVGSGKVAYKGTFDGGYHTLKVGYNLEEQLVAPFRKVNGATVKNLHVTGSITTNQMDAAGLIGQAEGDASSVSHCESSVAMTWTGSGDATNGGFVGRASAPVTFDNCLFNGSFSTENGNCFGGFVGWAEQNVTINNSLMASGNIKVTAAQDAGTGNASFVRGSATVNNSYYKAYNNLQIRNGLEANADQLSKGEVAYNLQTAQTEPQWAQRIGTDQTPVLTTSADHAVCKAVYVSNGSGTPNVISTVYATRGTAFPKLTFDAIVSSDYTDAPASGDKTFTLQANNGSTIIFNKVDWDNFASTYDGGTGTYSLVADINDAVTTMVGSENVPFKGTFDGRGHKLTISYYYVEEHVAPFRFISGATIKNLHTAGYMESIRQFCGGIAGRAIGDTSYINDCQSSVTMHWRNTRRSGLNRNPSPNADMTWGGILGRAVADVVINNCLFDGEIDDERINTLRGKNTGGFVGWSEKSVSIKNSWMTGRIQSVANNRSANNATFARGIGVSVENSYWSADRVEYNNQSYTYQGTRIDGNDKLASGELAALLQGSQTEPHWGQTITGDQPDTRPMLTSNLDKVVCMATFKAGNDVKGTSIVNRGQYFTMPDITGYDMLYDNKQPATRNIVVALFQKDANGFYTINNRDDWDNFAAYYKGAGNYRLGADINGITTMACTSDKNPFRGTFDGQGHTLTVNYSTDEQYAGSFRYIDGATITNLHTAGTISGSRTSGCIGGLAGNAINNASTITNCQSSVALTFTGSGDATHAGFLGIANAPVTFNNCAFTGSLTAEDGEAVAGLVGWATRHVDINNCLVAANVKVPANNRGEQGNAGFGRNWRQYSVNNSYVVKFDNVDVNQGTYITDEQVKSGAMAYMLQGSQDKQYWGQDINSDSLPTLTANNEKHVYKAAFSFEGDEVATVYANTGKNFPKLTTLKYETADPANYTSQAATQDIAVKLTLFKKDSDNNWLINNVDDWNTFAAVCTKGNYRLGANIEGVTTMAGTSEKPFTGKFDGQGHTLTVDITGSGQGVAPFRYVKDVNIHDLQVAGSVHQTGSGENMYHTSGFAGFTNGATFSRVASSVNITFDNSGDAHSGGLVGHGLSSTINFNDCAFTGNVSQKAGNGNDNQSFGGFVGWCDRGGRFNVANSYVDLTLTNINGQNNYVRSQYFQEGNSQFTNCYYTVPDGVKDWDPEPKTIKVTAEQMKSGYVANLLQNAHNTDNVMTWGQTLNSGQPQARPVLTRDQSQRVYRARLMYGDDVLATVYANQNTAFAVPEIKGYKSFYDNAPALADIDLQLVGRDIHLIEDKQDWDYFCDNYDGDTDTYSLVADLTGDNTVTKMVGSADKPFMGTFDGRGHTLTLNLNSDGQMTAPFSWVKGATIKHLRTAGKVNSSDYHASGLVGRSFGVTIINCEVDVDVQYTKKQPGYRAYSGGFVGHGGDDYINIESCAFFGKFSSADDQHIGGAAGFVGWGGSDVSFKNCYAHYAVGKNSSTVYPFIGSENVNSLTMEDCFAASDDYTVNGVKMYYMDRGNNKCRQLGRQMVESGFVAYTLQGTQTDQYWGQAVGTDEIPQLTSDAAKRVIGNTYDGEFSKVYDNCVIINEYKGNKANIDTYAGTTGKVKLLRTFADGWNTLVLPFSLTTEEVNEAFGDDTQVAYFTNNTPNTIELNTNTNGDKAIETNTPVLIKPSKDVNEIGDLTFSAKTITNVDEAKVEGVNDINFIGSYDALFTVPKDDYYFINGTNLWKSEGKTTIKGTRAYFHAPGQNGAKLRLFIDGVEANSSATGISSVKGDELGGRSYSSAVYTLSGQKVADSLEEARKANLKTGVYIVNGKKVVIK